jgi:Cation transporter/ATPase, N-terminus
MARTELLDDPSLVEVQAVAEALDTDLDAGLSSAEASRRLTEEGPNELRAAPPVPAWPKILAQFQDPLIYLLLGAVALSLLAWLIEGPRWLAGGRAGDWRCGGSQRRPGLRGTGLGRERCRCAATDDGELQTSC